MNDKRYPWMKFYPRDWISDIDLRRCSIAARGLWMDLICYMSQGQDFGRLVDGAGVKPSVKQLAEDARISEAECSALLSELKARNVFSEDVDGVIYSRRMVRDAENSRRNAENGAKGGNPRLLNRDTRGQKLDTRASLTASVKLEVIQLIQNHPQNTQLLSSTWSEWVSYRMSLKKSKDWRAMFERQVKMLSAYDAAMAIKMMNASMTNEWQGLIEPRAGSAGVVKPKTLRQEDLI